MRSHPLFQLTLTKLRDLWREPEALFWIFVFPLLLALVLAVAFRSKPPDRLAIGVVEGEGAPSLSASLATDPGLAPRLLDLDAARAELRAGRVALVVLPGEPWVYWYDPPRPESRLARLAVDDALQRAAGRTDARVVEDREMTERGSRYIDFLIPGLLGMNLMGTGIWGIGFYIVSARSKHLLKRLVAAPMRRTHFLVSQITGRLLFLLPEVGVLLLVAHYVLDVPMRGSLGGLVTISFLGAATFSGLGLLVAARPRTVEGVSGLMNLVMLPMWVLSGIFFSTARFPDAVQPLIKALPLTAVIDALRANMIDGAPLASLGTELAVAAAWAVLAFVVALALFRWD